MHAVIVGAAAAAAAAATAALCLASGWAGCPFFGAAVSLLLSFAAAAAAAWRMHASLPSQGSAASTPLQQVRMLAVLGSGGHTTEMFYDLETLGSALRYDIHYVIAATDKGSGGKADAFELQRTGKPAAKHIVPRAREVGQSYFTSIFTTLRSAVTSFAIVFRLMPDIVVCNGPGTCVPIAAAAYASRFFGIKRIHVIYSESMACVSHLSLSGKILYHFADHFTVQWDTLHALLPKAKYAGRCRPGLPPRGAGVTGDGRCIVTVGSTMFEALIKSVDSDAVLDALRALGIKEVVVQKGNGKHFPSAIAEAPDVKVFEYSQEVPAMLRSASLVLSHAGAGTVLDCLLNDRDLIIVPNETLMSNHQVQLAEELEKYKLVRWCRPGDLLSTLRAKAEPLAEFPKQAAPVFKSCVAGLVGE